MPKRYTQEEAIQLVMEKGISPIGPYPGAPPIKPLPRTVSKNYQELAHFINLQIKQKKARCPDLLSVGIRLQSPQG